MPSTTDTKISPSKLMGRPVGANAPLIMGNQKAIKINARKITVLKNLAESNQKRWSGDTMADKLPGGEGLGKTLNDIANNMDSIKNTIIEQQDVDKGIAEDDRRAKEKATRGNQEKNLEEDKFAGLKQTAKKVLAPVKSVWEKILKFITTIFLGKLAMKVFDWFADEENKKKVEAIGRFFKDFWPALLAGYLAFGTAIGRFVVGLGAKLVVWGATIVMKAIPALVKAAVAMGPWGIAALAALGIAGGAMYMGSRQKDQRQEDNKKDDASTLTVDEYREDNKDVKEPGKKKANIPLSQAYGETGTFPGMMNFNQGGQIPGKGPNKDTVPAMLTPGEFVMSAPAVQKWGLSTLEGMNAAGGGTNKPKKDNDGVTYANDGGWISGLFGGKKDSNNAQGSLKGLTMKDYKDLAFIVSGEAQRGTSDEYGVAASVLNRVADPRYPDTIKAVGAEKDQYEAVFTGKAYDDPELAVKLASPAGQSGILSALQRLQGRTDFKGTSQYKNMGEGDVKFSPRGNFYHYAEQVVKSDPPPQQIPTHWKKFVGSSGGIGATQSMSTPGSRRGSTPANVSAPPPVTSINPPSKGKVSSVIAYAQQKGQAPAGQNAQPLPSASLPEFHAAIMNSQAKIKVLGITV